jgi:HTH-type transcriptional regulator/antitoxin HigA
MRSTQHIKSTGKVATPEDFNALNAQLPLRPINDRVDLDNAMEMVDRLALLKRRTKDQEDYLETLSTLIEKYEAEHDSIRTDSLDPIETLKYLMAGREMTASQLGNLLGERSLGSKILTGERELSKNHIRALCKAFEVGPEVFLKI